MKFITEPFNDSRSTNMFIISVLNLIIQALTLIATIIQITPML